MREGRVVTMGAFAPVSGGQRLVLAPMHLV